MIGITEIASHIPETGRDGFELGRAFNLDAEFVKAKTGMQFLSRKSENEETSDLCVQACLKLVEKVPNLSLSEIDCIIVCTQNPDGYGLPNTSSHIHKKLSLSESCAAFDISLGCSGYIYGLSVIKSFMTANSLKNGLLFTCDPYSKVVDPSDKDTALLFGDAASVTYLSENFRWNIGKAFFGSRGEGLQHIEVKEKKLRMNGRAVFNFAATVVPRNIQKTIEENGLSKGDVHRFIVHQGSRYVVDTIRARLEVPEEKMPFVAGTYGNTVSSSIPIALENADTSQVNIIISGFGVGLSWGSCLLTQKPGFKEDVSEQ